MYQNFIGIDIGKAEFFCADYEQNDVARFDNSENGFERFADELASKLQNALVIIETTGGYEMALIRYLQAKKIAVHRANTRKVKHFIRSYGQLGKSDAIDARGLAHYGSERHSKLDLFVEQPYKRLVKLVGRRIELKQMLVKEKNRRKAPEQKDLLFSFETIITALETEIVKIENEINLIFASNKELLAQKEILKEISGIGDIIATQLIALMPELGRLNRKQIASLGGLAPHPNESGKRIGYRFTRGGRQGIKSILFLAAMTASRSNSSLGEAYQRFLDNGKKKMVALTALMRKILVIANAKMRDYYASSAADGEKNDIKLEHLSTSPQASSASNTRIGLVDPVGKCV